MLTAESLKKWHHEIVKETNFALHQFKILQTTETTNSVNNGQKDITSCYEMLTVEILENHISLILTTTNFDYVLPGHPSVLIQLKRSPQVSEQF